MVYYFVHAVNGYEIYRGEYRSDCYCGTWEKCPENRKQLLKMGYVEIR